jgi:OOP family OmpA-OmpF porin
MELPPSSASEIVPPAPPPKGTVKTPPKRTPPRPAPPPPPVAEPPPADPGPPEPASPRAPASSTGRYQLGPSDLLRNEARAVLLPVYFKGKSKRLSREAKDRIDEVAEFMKRHEQVELLVRGYTDESSVIEKNLALGHERAESVARYLERRGIDPSRLKAVAYGIDRQDEPAPADSDNRVEFVMKE